MMQTLPSRCPAPALASRIELAELATPIGRVVIGMGERGLCALDFAKQPVRARLQRTHPGAKLGQGSWCAPVLERLRAYFAGELEALSELPVQATGTPFQQEVWRALRSIPAGSTLSYSELASRIGRPRAVRAVGAANGRNPVALVVPCHRVIAADGTLGGYAGGLARKAWLLQHERAR